MAVDERRRALLLCWLLAGGVFATFSSESMVGAMLPQIAHDQHVPVGAAAGLISAFAAGQVVGPWAMGLPLARFSPRVVLSALLTVFGLLQVIVCVVPLPAAIGLRLLMGAAMTAYMTIALGTAIRAWPGTDSARAVAIVFAGGTIGITLGIPLASLLGHVLGWRSVFLIDSGCGVLAAIALLSATNTTPGVPVTFPELRRQLSNRHLWMTFATAGLTLGSSLLGFAFFSTILERLTGFSPLAVTSTLVIFGAASIVGTFLVGRLSATGATRVVAVGLTVQLGALLTYWIAPQVTVVAVAAVAMVGLTGAALNPAQTTRNVEAGGATPGVMAMSPTVATAGIFLATFIGGFAADSSWGITTPLLVGAVLAGCALLTLLPDARQSHRRRRTPLRFEHPLQ